MKKPETGEKAKVKFRLLEFEAEGGSAALQDGLRQFVTALSRASAPPPPRSLPARPVDQGAPGAEVPVNGELFPLSPDATEGDTEVDITPEPPSEPKVRQPRKPPTFTVINGLNLDAGDGYPSLGDFAKQKAAEGHTARYLVSAVWLKRHADIKDFTADHAFTVYKRLGWGSTPTDAGQPLRDLKRAKLIDQGEKAGSFTVNDAGFDKVDRMGGA
jgi:hypothetical protein